MKTAIIIGAGPAGLTAAYELLEKSDIKPIVLEADEQVGGLAKTVNYKGNRIDIGGHRFFSKSDTIIRWWQKILPLQGQSGDLDSKALITYQGKSRSLALSRVAVAPTAWGVARRGETRPRAIAGNHRRQSARPRTTRSVLRIGR